MKSNKKIPFSESLWTHFHSWTTYTGGDLPGIATVSHWGKKETCRKCHLEGTAEHFRNWLSGRGVGLLFATVVVCLIGLGLFAN
jgi:hypothetical protein